MRRRIGSRGFDGGMGGEVEEWRAGGGGVEGWKCEYELNDMGCFRRVWEFVFWLSVITSFDGCEVERKGILIG